MPYPESLEIAGAQLRRWDAQRDVSLLHAMAADQGVARFIPLPGEAAGLEAMSRRFSGHWEACGFGLWAVRGPDGTGAGWLGACHPRWHPEFEHRVELAWSLTEGLRGRGLATGAARAAAEACFTELGLDEIIAFVDPANGPSLAVVERLGMERAGATAHPADGVELTIFRLSAGRPRVRNATVT